MTTPEIEPATPSEVPAIIDCAHAAYAEYLPLIGRKPAPMVADFAGHVRRSEIFVARVRGAFAGYIVFFARDDAMFLENVAVHPDMAGRGIGTALIGFCERCAREAGLAQVRLYTNEKMGAPLALYPKLGYREVDRRREDGFNRVYFARYL
ncbi:MAG TPA: GNAT family N-acetyltransferase [Marivita sp.]|nr:GNAT family N-acetyltransferase [Marivita sp.]